MKELAKPKSKYAKFILQKADSKLIQAICESIYNILEGSLPLDNKQKTKLIKHKSTLRKLIEKSSLKDKKKLLVQRGSGFLPLLLPTVLSSLFSIFAPK